ncbi:aminofutalosine synthase MqnE [Plantactinospora sp. WMMC1484]|uniref:aminofutalosine synthase MqnE n=1 Tax=Plantactinospora sp. WMMC1484 TaxID=3404122 RepID=UPI003BF51427
MDAGRKRELEEKVYAGARLSRADGEALYTADDLVWLGRLAHRRRAGHGGDQVLFAVERRLTLAGAGAVAEIVRRATELAADGITGLQLVGPSHPGLPWEHYPELLRALRAALPDVELTAFSATDIHRLEEQTGRTADEILDELVDAGLASMTGGGAEIFDPEVRAQLAVHDCDWADWVRIHRAAFARGIGAPATMRYGHVEEPRHRVDHLLRLREVQDETGGFATFVPLRHRHDVADPTVGGPGAGPSGRSVLPGRSVETSPAASLRTFAVSRLLLDNVPHLTACWATHGFPVAQLSLGFGVDDLAGSAAAPQVAGDADPFPEPNRDVLLDLIRDADFRPVERDTRHAVVREYDAPPSLAERRAVPQRVWA